LDLLKIQKKDVPNKPPTKRVRCEWTWSSLEILSNNHRCNLAKLWHILITVIMFMITCQDAYGGKQNCYRCWFNCTIVLSYTSLQLQPCKLWCKDGEYLTGVNILLQIHFGCC
jgi:hypothetical protein